MPKKIFDVIPPEQRKEIKRIKKDALEERPVLIRRTIQRTDFIEEVSGRIEKKEDLSKKFQKKYEAKALKRAFKGFLLICLSVLIVGFMGIVLNSVFNIKVKISIWPKVENVNLTNSLSINLSQKDIDYEKGILPGQTINRLESQSNDFKTTGKKNKLEKATGTIHVYNSFSDASQSLITGTRFVSADGKLFKTTAKQVIPGGTYKSGKLVAGEIDISVEAAEAGEEYNIGPTTFSIPGFAGTPKYTAFYGKSFSAMSGGAKKEVFIATQDDLDNAEAAATDKIKKDGLDSLRASLSEDLILIDGAVIQEIKEKTFSLKVGDEGDKVNLKMSVDSTGVVFKKSDMRAFAENAINNAVQQGNTIQGGSIQKGYAFKSLNYKEIAKTDKKQPPESSKELLGIDFSSNISAKYYQQIDIEKMKANVLGKSFDGVKAYLSDGSLKIDKVEINPGVFWRKSVPNNKEKVDMVLELNK